MTKIRYEIDLSALPITSDGSGVGIRSITTDDLEALARLMLDAYMGTIDYEGEDLDDARSEVRRFLEAEDTLLDRSFVVEDDGEVVSGILVSMEAGTPFIGYVMTLPSHKKTGLGQLVTSHALRRLASDGYESVALYITEGNVASEELFQSVGAVRVGEVSG